MKKEYKPISKFTFALLKLIVRPVAFFKWGYRAKSQYKIKKGDSVVVLSNHQTDVDPLFIHLSFNQLLYIVATDNIFKKGFNARFLSRMGGIPKRKGVVDYESDKKIIRLMMNKKSLIVFPEGNRSYAEFQYYIPSTVAKTFRRFKSTIILFNFHGGFGKYPRWGNKARKGQFYGEIARILPYSEYQNMSDEELTNIITTTLRVVDAESGNLYKSNKKAEFLERMFFVCPKCGQHSTLVSKGNFIRCTKCDFEAEYHEDLTITSKDLKSTMLTDWYNYQKRWVRDYVPNDETIFTDKEVVLRNCNPFTKNNILAKGDLTLTKDKLTIGDRSFTVKDILVSSPVSGRKFVFTYQGNEYDVKGNERFNALKYVLMMNKLSNNTLDKHYSVWEDEK